MNSNVHVAKMVPTAGLEPAQIAPLAPQTSASTNFATSACQWPYGQTFNGVRFANPDNAAALRADKKIHCRINDLRLNNPGRSPYCGVVAGAGVAGVCCTGAGDVAGAGGVDVTGVCAGVGVVSTDRSNTLVGSPGDRVPM